MSSKHGLIGVLLLSLCKMIKPDITDKQIFRALGNFLKSLFPDIPVIKGQVNRTPMPKTGFICINNTGKRFLSMNRHAYDVDNQIEKIQASTNYIIQADFYGKDSGDWVQAFVDTFKDSYGFDVFPEHIKPLTTGEPAQIPIDPGEKQYLERWKVSVELQYNPNIDVPMTFFNEIDIQLIDTTTIHD